MNQRNHHTFNSPKKGTLTVDMTDASTTSVPFDIRVYFQGIREACPLQMISRRDRDTSWWKKCRSNISSLDHVLQKSQRGWYGNARLIQYLHKQSKSDFMKLTFRDHEKDLYETYPFLSVIYSFFLSSLRGLQIFKILKIGTPSQAEGGAETVTLQMDIP